MENTMNFTSQRISFVNKISILQKALSNDETPTPSYLYKEINDISYESIGYCESLVEFLVDHLRHNSCHVKLKTLKVIKHVTENGSKEFQLGMRQNVALVKECSKFSGAPHPVHGNKPFVMVRQLATELCETLYNLDPLSLKSSSQSVEKSRVPDPKYGGMGPSSRSGGAIQGFGNTPHNKPKSIASTILHGLEKLGTKLSESPADRQAAVLARLDLSGSSSNYQPPVIPTEFTLRGSGGYVRSPLREQSPVKSESRLEKSMSQHRPGKAGGGWNDDEESDEDNGNAETNQSSGTSDDTNTQMEMVTSSVHSQDNTEERSVVDNLVANGNISQTESMFLTNSSIAEFLSKCSTLRCGIVVDYICQLLPHKDPCVISRCLQLLEGMIYNRQQLMHLDTMAVKCKTALVDCFVTMGKRISQLDQHSNQEEGVHLKSVHIKAAKVLLIIQQLSSHKDLIPPAQIASQLSFTPPVPSQTPTMAM